MLLFLELIITMLFCRLIRFSPKTRFAVSCALAALALPLYYQNLLLLELCFQNKISTCSIPIWAAKNSICRTLCEKFNMSCASRSPPLAHVYCFQGQKVIFENETRYSALLLCLTNPLILVTNRFILLTNRFMLLTNLFMQLTGVIAPQSLLMVAGGKTIRFIKFVRTTSMVIFWKFSWFIESWYWFYTYY